MHRGRWWEKMKEIERLDDIDIYIYIFIWENDIKIDLKKLHGREWTEFIRLGIELSGRLL
jgi:hypothetical protein